jgi:hypothetical protein
MKEKETDLLTYACILARHYGLALGRKNSRDPLIKALGELCGMGVDPYREYLDMEHSEIFAWMQEHKCLESQVVDVVRKTIPSTNWDNSIREICKATSEVLDTNNTKELETLTRKLELIRNSDFEDRLKLEALLEESPE